MTQKEIENSLEGGWQNLKSNYLWIFYPLSDGQRNGTVADNNTPVGSRFFNYEINIEDDENIIIDLIIVGKKTPHRIIFLTDKIIEIYNLPIDNVGNVQNDSTVLNKVSP